MNHDYKKQVVSSYCSAIRVLIETGTYYGEMVEAQMGNFDRIISIELSERLYTKAIDKFKDVKNVVILKGDSGKLLPSIVRTLHEPAIFWLDGHYSGGVTVKGEKETPIREELACILNHHLKHVILIDDARCFGQGDYPTLEEIQEMAENYHYYLENDIIRLT